jgi:hypothetical protein
VAWLKDDGHAGVYGAEELVGFRSDDGEGLEPLTCGGVKPCVPEAGEGGGEIVVQREDEGFLCDFGFLCARDGESGGEGLPLVETVGRDEAAMALE